MSRTVAARWTGQLELELVSARGWRHGVAQIIVRVDTVEIWTRRQVALLHRAQLREWLCRHRVPLAQDDVVWTIVEGGRFALSVDGSDPYLVPLEVTDELLRRL